MSEPNESQTREGNETRMPPLQTYLGLLRRAVLGDPMTARNLVLVMGNPSADLDSFVSAVTLSYFYNLRQTSSASASALAQSSTQPLYVPILNLPHVQADDLWRLRPEFDVALNLATRQGQLVGEIDRPAADRDARRRPGVLEQLVTIADIRRDQSSLLHPLFTASDSPSEHGGPGPEKQAVVLVDHNAPSIPGQSEAATRARFDVVGCIDHHVDEDYVPPHAVPRIVRTGIGSCTSLVVQHLRDEGLWPPPSDQAAPASGVHEVSQLTLAPILIDTANLQATGDKCSDTDRDMVRFLESWIAPRPEATTSRVDQVTVEQGGWSRDDFHRALSQAKSDSLDRLTMQEIFDRDFKAWTERATPSSSSTASTPADEVHIGISSLVKPLSWLVQHAGGLDTFLDEIRRFATGAERHLHVYALLTRAGHGKEVVVIAMDPRLRGVTADFERHAAELDLGSWRENADLRQAWGRRSDTMPDFQIWWMGDTSKSRKQVGPLLRETVKGLGSSL